MGSIYKDVPVRDCSLSVHMVLMIMHTSLAGNSDQYARIMYSTGHSYPTARIDIFGARFTNGAGVMEIGNGDRHVEIDLRSADAPSSPRGGFGDPGEIHFSALVIFAHKRIEGLQPGGRVDVLITPLERVLSQAVTQEVMHMKRVLHGPGPYPDHHFGRWINGYRQEAAERLGDSEVWAS